MVNGKFKTVQDKETTFHNVAQNCPSVRKSGFRDSIATKIETAKPRFVGSCFVSQYPIL